MLPVLVFASSAAEAAVDAGSVIAVDGKGAYQVATRRNGTIDFYASKRLFEDDPMQRTPSYPHGYKEIRVGDRIQLTWGHDKADRCIGEGIRILKRANSDK